MRVSCGLYLIAFESRLMNTRNITSRMPRVNAASGANASLSAMFFEEACDSASSIALRRRSTRSIAMNRDSSIASARPSWTKSSASVSERSTLLRMRAKKSSFCVSGASSRRSSMAVIETSGERRSCERKRMYSSRFLSASFMTVTSTRLMSRPRLSPPEPENGTMFTKRSRLSVCFASKDTGARSISRFHSGAPCASTSPSTSEARLPLSASTGLPINAAACALASVMRSSVSTTTAASGKPSSASPTKRRMSRTREEARRTSSMRASSSSDNAPLRLRAMGAA